MTLRPKDFFSLMKARWGKPRERARDMRADEFGLALKLQVIDHIIEADPDPDQLAATLAQFAAQAGPHSGPVRGICTDLLYDWDQAQMAPAWVEWLKTPPGREGEGKGKGKRRPTSESETTDELG